VSRAARQGLRNKEEGACEAVQEETTGEAIGIQGKQETGIDKG